ncbi:hypothetical protein V6N11_066694 [Hibiscus sabdariffa]|uniref:Uncharacterized protein n=1 Tax=Hibiscus sabdariffa TaxID=183260 RepID=A0ABR1Z5R5_9ROSI
MSFVDDIPPHGGRYCHHTNQVLSSLDDVEELHPQGFVTRYIAKGLGFTLAGGCALVFFRAGDKAVRNPSFLRSR